LALHDALPIWLRVRPLSVLQHRPRPLSGAGTARRQRHPGRIRSRSEPLNFGIVVLRDRLVNGASAKTTTESMRSCRQPADVCFAGLMVALRLNDRPAPNAGALSLIPARVG